MSITLSVDATHNQGESGSAQTISITPVTDDTLMVIAVTIDDTTEGDISSVTTSQTGTVVQGADFTNGSRRTRLYYIINPVVAAHTITLNFTAATDYFLDAATFKGTAVVSPVDVTATSNGTDGSPTTSITPTAGAGLIVWIGHQSTNGTFSSPGTGQSIRGQAVQGGAEKMSAWWTSEIFTAAPGAQSGTLSKSGAWIGLAVEIKEAGIGAVRTEYSQGLIPQVLF